MVKNLDEADMVLKCLTKELEHRGGRVTLSELKRQLEDSKNPVTRWALKECIKDRIERNDFE